jgi:hypothetical protein
MVRLAQALVEGTTALSALVAVQRRARWRRARLLDIQSDLLDLHSGTGVARHGRVGAHAEALQGGSAMLPQHVCRRRHVAIARDEHVSVPLLHSPAGRAAPYSRSLCAAAGA